MGFTMVEVLDVTSAALVMDDAWFARPLALSDGLGNQFYNLEIGGLASGTILGPTASAHPPFQPGIADVFGSGTPVLVEAVIPFLDAGGQYWAIEYYSLEPGSSLPVANVNLPLQAGFAFNTPGAAQLLFEYQTGQASPTLHLSDFAPAGTMVGAFYDREAANLIQSGGGDDLLRGFGGDDTITAAAGADSVEGGDGNDRLAALEDLADLGDGAIDTLAGGAGNDSLVGDADKDVLSGDDGNDLLQGHAGADKMTGGKGNDTLEGDVGRDVMSGGKGRDVFSYATAGALKGGADKISDFTPVDDQILVSAGFFGGGLKAGMDVGATGHFVANLTGVASSSAGIGQFVYDTDDGKLYWDADGAGSGKAVLMATLGGLPVLTAADFTVIG